MTFTETLSARLRALWFGASIISSTWFLYWICYDLLFWNKGITQTGPANYAAFTLSIVLVILGTQLGRLGILEKLTRFLEQTIHKEAAENPHATEKKQIKPIKQVRQIQPPKEKETKQTPPGVSVPRGCKFYLGYLHKCPKSEGIPEECLECEHVVECLSPTASTIECASS